MADRHPDIQRRILGPVVARCTAEEINAVSAAVSELIDALRAEVAAARIEGLRDAEKMVRANVLSSPHPSGPGVGAGWNQGTEAAANIIRAHIDLLASMERGT